MTVLTTSPATDIITPSVRLPSNDTTDSLLYTLCTIFVHDTIDKLQTPGNCQCTQHHQNLSELSHNLHPFLSDNSPSNNEQGNRLRFYCLSVLPTIIITQTYSMLASCLALACIAKLVPCLQPLRSDISKFLPHNTVTKESINMT